MNSGHEGITASLGGFEAGYQPVAKRPARLLGAQIPWRWLRGGIGLRIGLLFGALCLIKIALMIGLRRHLFEIHWRHIDQPYNWINEPSFYLFAVLTGLHLWRLGTHCMASGKRVVRSANLCILILGAAFILLTFHEGDKNYLSPVINGVLAWNDMKWYMAMNFFFRPPYLSAWIFGYGCIYYCLVRTNREYLVLRITAVCATLYIALYLSDLADCHDALIIADCVGLVCLLSAWKSKQTLNLFWTGLFGLTAAFIFGLFYGLDPRLMLSRVDPEFALLTGTCLALVLGVSGLAWRLGFFNGWSWTLPFALASFLLLVNARYPLARNYNNLICGGFTLPRYFLGEIVIASLLFVAASAYRRWRPSGSLWWLDVLNFLLIIDALADLRLSQIMGERLDWQALSLATGETPKMMWRMAKPYLPALLGVLLVAIGLYTAVFRRLRPTHRSIRFQPSQRWSRGPVFLVLSFVCLGLIGKWLTMQDKAEGQSTLVLAETSPLWRRAVDPPMDEKTFIKTARLLGMDQLLQPGSFSPRTRRDLNVVLIFQESTYNKYLSLFNGTEDTEPLLSKYKDRMEIFPNFFSSFAGSINARFAAFTGLYPGRDFAEFTFQRVEVKSIFELLHDQGYACSLFYSSFLDYTGFRDFLKDRKLDEIYDAETMPGARKTEAVSWGLREEETLGAIKTQIKSYVAKNRKFFLTYVPAAPHNPFDGTPARFRKHHTDSAGDFTPAYLNELLYMDWVVASIIDELRDSGALSKTLVIITDDHGEMLGANGGPIGHGWAVSPELANVPLIIMDPGRPGYRINYTVGSQVDLPLTILDVLGLPIPSNQLFQGNSLYSLSGEAERMIYTSSLRQYGIIKGRNIICGDRSTGHIGDLQTVCVISNQDNRTFYVGLPSEGVTAPSISVFDKFQGSLLRHYSRYNRMQEPSGHE